MCLPDMTDNPILKSSTDLAIGPSLKKALDIPISSKGAIVLTKGILPIEGFIDVMPQQ